MVIAGRRSEGGESANKTFLQWSRQSKIAEERERSGEDNKDNKDNEDTKDNDNDKKDNEDNNANDNEDNEEYDNGHYSHGHDINWSSVWSFQFFWHRFHFNFHPNSELTCALLGGGIKNTLEGEGWMLCCCILQPPAEKGSDWISFNFFVLQQTFPLLGRKYQLPTPNKLLVSKEIGQLTFSATDQIGRYCAIGQNNVYF